MLELFSGSGGCSGLGACSRGSSSSVRRGRGHVVSTAFTSAANISVLKEAATWEKWTLSLELLLM